MLASVAILAQVNCHRAFFFVLRVGVMHDAQTPTKDCGH
jgi:hypothetical protein